MKLISVYSTAGKLEAEIIKGFLEAQGLQVILNQESVGQTIGLSAGRLGKVDVLVPDTQVAEAKDLIKAIANGDYEDYPNYDSEEDIEE
jgi:hypothetical protein